MTSQRIVCTTHQPVFLPTTHSHIVAVRIGPAVNACPMQWTASQVLEAIDRGEQFFTFGEQSHKTAGIEAVACPNCGCRIIQSTGDAVKDNNLDSLKRCGASSRMAFIAPGKESPVLWESPSGQLVTQGMPASILLE